MSARDKIAGGAGASASSDAGARDGSGSPPVRSSYFEIHDWFDHQAGTTTAYIRNYGALLSHARYLRLTLAERGLLHGLWLHRGITGRNPPAEPAAIAKFLRLARSRHLEVQLEALQRAGWIRKTRTSRPTRKDPRRRIAGQEALEFGAGGDAGPDSQDHSKASPRPPQSHAEATPRPLQDHSKAAKSGAGPRKPRKGSTRQKEREKERKRREVESSKRKRPGFRPLSPDRDHTDRRKTVPATAAATAVLERIAGAIAAREDDK